MSFWELLVIVVVGLLVIGPERLPEALRTGAMWMGRMKRAINNTKAEFEQQLGMDEIRRELHNEQVLASLRELEDSSKGIEKEINKVDAQIQAEIKRIENSIDEPVPHERDANADANEGLEAQNTQAADGDLSAESKQEAENDPFSETNANPDHFRRP
ncbi:Sec-independent protein translocase protein TatB [Agaribacterium haliotis]|uniref:Sec-independent protein translocase protein TatB n=1 Tax=Agaribacterium haliotis TaxID=2013869 RepID=UPI000BB52B98|nr:Sec-independent protein translocase protein TatB [Agaribacterium haliotis]